MSHNHGTVGSMESQQGLCGPFQLKALRNFSLTHFQAGPTDKKNTFLCGHWRQRLREDAEHGLPVFEHLQRT